MSQKRKRSPDGGNAADVFRSAPIEDRSSTFIGYFSPTLKPKDLQSLPEFAEASHKILGWRRESNQQAITGGTKYITGSNDDGEKYGGKKVEKVLESMKVSGACVVARWYGGVMLGPVRFTHMESCAKEAVRKWQVSKVEEGVKKRKEEADASSKSKLMTTLTNRDESIVVLRKLAAEKELQVKQAKASTDADPNGMPSKDGTPEKQQMVTPTKSSIDYSSMPLERLRMLEKARDATLSFLLKRIDTAEAELAVLQSELAPD